MIRSAHFCWNDKWQLLLLLLLLVMPFTGVAAMLRWL
jgi:hypothetical protein